MSKRSAGYKPTVTARELPPKLGEVKGDVRTLCPFCEHPHPIAVGKISRCGTQLRVTAIQTVVPTRTVNKFNLKCIKCGQGGGKMVKFNEGYIHLHECTPNTTLLAEEPVYSDWARFVYGLPDLIRKPIERRTGAARRVDQIDQDGKETGHVAGYFFYRGTG